MRKVVFLLVSILVLSSTVVYADDNTAKDTEKEEVKEVRYGTEITFENADQGVVTVFQNAKTEKKMKLTVTLGKERYIYNVFNNNEPVNYPLQLGEGTYKVTLYENTTGSKYKRIATESYEVEYEEENAVYLQSVLEINWDEEDESIQLADELVAEALEEKREGLSSYRAKRTFLTEEEIIEVFYYYILENIEYDFDKIDGLDYSYLPNNDATIDVKTGICYDYSSLFASMLRSQGIPAKMIKGYAKTSEVYHAWNEVYLESEERWIVIDTTYDAYMHQKDRDYDMEKDPEDFNKVKEF